MSELTLASLMTDAELLAAIDNRFDIVTYDIPRGGYGLSWHKEMPRPTLDNLKALREMAFMVGVLEKRWESQT